MSFTRKPLSVIEPLGAKLRQAREAVGMTQHAVAIQTGIPAKYLDALEGSRYEELPGEVYVKNFLRITSEFFHLSLIRVMELYEQERRVTRRPASPTPPRALSKPRVVNVSKLVRNVGVALGVAVLLLYLGLKVQTVIKPPVLTVTAPAQDLLTTETTLQVEGVTEPESIVRINGQDVSLGTDGHFSERIDLQPGLNVIKVSAVKERSHEQVVYRQVILEQQQATGPTTEFHP